MEYDNLDGVDDDKDDEEKGNVVQQPNVEKPIDKTR
jgi:hypothetical protein